jgi:hypothetical protein
MFEGRDPTGRSYAHATNISGRWTIYLTPWACGRDGGQRSVRSKTLRRRWLPPTATWPSTSTATRSIHASIRSTRDAAGMEWTWLVTTTIPVLTFIGGLWWNRVDGDRREAAGDEYVAAYLSSEGIDSDTP